MDTILKNISMPKIYVANLVKEGDLYRLVIDGQQRIRDIIAFIRDEFELKKPYKDRHIDKKFNEHPKKLKDMFLWTNIYASIQR